MNYQRVYDQIIDRARTRKLDEYSEVHHILPKALGGSDDEDNLVSLTYREHFLVHWMLAKVCYGRDRMVMAYALHLMTMKMGGRIVSGWRIDLAKRTLRREYFRRRAQRRWERKEERKIRFKEISERAARVVSDAPTIKPERIHAPRILQAMTGAWLKRHDPRIVNRKGLRPRANRSDQPYTGAPK